MERRVLATVIDPQAGRDTPEAFVETFEALLADADTAGFLSILGIGRFSLLAKRRMEPVFSALCVGLWKLALSRACPERSEAAYDAYLEQLRPRIKDADAYMVLLCDVAGYLPEQAEADFTPLAREMFARAHKEPDQADTMAMVLFLRRLYSYFFNHLM